eukprot:TRINITY_DN68854_c0_g1_i1.p1 TRINITY_DN68854_c0_g1~~TRINITY_DN68854_c0_g1_i1.p1  ORF type:complete len:323 (+),score=27.17 TRINITY_DN68854_c0_g1_i1:51-1019(+)
MLEAAQQKPIPMFGKSILPTDPMYEVYGKLPYDTSKFHIKPDAHGGFGWFAVRDLAPGTRLIREWPLFTYDTYESLADKKAAVPDKKSVQDALDKLSEGQRNMFEELMDAHGGKAVHHGICETNGFALADHKAGIFPTLARVNHSCTPNARYQWKQHEKPPGVMDLYVDLPIKEGEEITISYCAEITPRDVRRDTLKKYQFECNCVACSLTGEAQQTSDSNRSRMREIRKNFAIKEATGGEEGLKLLKELEELQIAEGVNGAEIRGSDALMKSTFIRAVRPQEEWLQSLKEAYTAVRFAEGQDSQTARHLKEFINSSTPMRV